MAVVVVPLRVLQFKAICGNATVMAKRDNNHHPRESLIPSHYMIKYIGLVQLFLTVYFN